MAFITQFYTWATGNTITAARLNGNISDIIDGLDGGTKDINIAKLQIAGSDVIDGSQNLTLTGDITGTSSTATKPTWMLKNTNADSNSAELQFYKLSASPADNDDVGKISFYGNDDGAVKTLYGQILAESTDVTDATEDGKITIYTMKGGSSTASLTIESGDSDFGTNNVTTGGILKIDVDGTAENAAGALTLGAGNDAGIFFDGTNLVIITNGAGASGIVLDAEDDTVEIKGSGTLQATFDTGGLDLVTGDAYEINNTSVLNATTLGSGVVTSSLTTVGALDSGSITSGFGDIDNGTSNITTGGIIAIDVDGTAEGAAGSLTLGAGGDAGIFFDGTDLVIITNGAGASGVIIDSEDDTVEIKGSGTLQATFDTGGLDLVTGDAYEINNTSVLNATTLGSGVVTSSLTTVGALDSGSITSGFGTIDTGVSNITTGGIIALDVDGTAEGAAGSLTLGAGNDAGIFFDGTDLVIITNGAGASGIILDAEDDTVEIKGSGVLQATFSATGLNLVSSLTMGDKIISDTTAGITASTTQTQGQQALADDINEISTVANDDDTVTLPAAEAGRTVLVTNNGANFLQIFPASSDNLGEGVDTARSFPPTCKIMFKAYDATNWEVVYANSDWVTYTPTTQAFGTPGANSAKYLYSNRQITVVGQLTTGTTTGAEMQIGLPGPLTISTVYDATATQIGLIQETSATDFIGYVLSTSGDAFINHGVMNSNTGSTAALTPKNGDAVYGAGKVIRYQYVVGVS